MSWRPDGWVNPYHITERALGTEVKFNQYPEFEVYEAGADAVLEALKKEARLEKHKYCTELIKIHLDGTVTIETSPKYGWLVFIEESNEGS